MSDIGLYEALRTTRAVRRLRPDPVPDALLRKVLEAATWAPSGGNRQPWRIIVVRDEATKRTFGELYLEPWRAYIAPAREASKSLPEPARSIAARNVAAGDHLAEHWHEVPVVLVFCFDPSLLAITDRKLARPSVVGGASIYPAVQNALLACRAEGLGCVLTTMLCQFEEKLRPILSLPDNWATAAFVPIGYPVGRGHADTLRRNPIEQMVFSERFGEPLDS
jgi:nitroreductase